MGSAAAPRWVDLNSDLGEGGGERAAGDDDALLDVVTSASIACGFHAGDPLLMRRTVAAAAARGVAIGAHPGPLDRAGFGRRSVAGVPPDALATAVAYQLGALRAVAAQEGALVTHVKLHGALSTAAAVDGRLAAAVGQAVAAVDDRLAWLVPAGSAMVAAAAGAGLRSISEVFADRGYAENGTLIPREEAGAVLADADAVAARAVAMVVDGAVTLRSGRRLPLRAESICVHGDTPGAVAMARRVRAALEGAGVAILPFASARRAGP